MSFEVFKEHSRSYNKPRPFDMAADPVVLKAQKDILQQLLYETYGCGKTNCSKTDIKNLIASIEWKQKNVI